MLISIIVPVFNAEHTIGQLCRTLVTELSQLLRGWRSFSWNDNSRDNSERACLDAARTSTPTSVTYLGLSRNFGEHNAVMAGLHHAQGEYMITIDDDLQNPPSGGGARCSRRWAKGYDIVYAQYISRRDNILRRLASRLHGHPRARVPRNKPDTQSPFRHSGS